MVGQHFFYYVCFKIVWKFKLWHGFDMIIIIHVKFKKIFLKLKYIKSQFFWYLIFLILAWINIQVFKGPWIQFLKSLFSMLCEYPTELINER
jgi:hypothetical protein